MFFETYQKEFVITGIVLVSLLLVRYITHVTVTKVAKKNGINEARIRLIRRYITVTLFLIAVLIEALVFGTEFHDLAVIFSSVFAVIGIGLFAIWSILSNITSGIIMFFNFPYKVGDKIEIHDKDFPITAIIEDIRAFQLHLRIENGDLVTYPNNLMLQKGVTLIEKDAIDDFSIDHEGSSAV
ncbi:mechanosensitive ion channel family protein [Algibacter amylolyticus]|uniref:Mechanosensitive ion channel family protein n=1 Tax=Algibacter amylolyticus TaxID=1608400 RepID=A0A5M7B5A7_9FLAO|nr:mechanosensitive ion channel domain-containing protein [Algibacter amylolyticus]KAA5823547.1 mechanosensitive ion channel family protein [Algibacter amylolyticus]MBB5267701.1 small-conductance mechanosensitive channel [Algibacter amylolyticus]TSJ74035.1 mechanosensitive ion channel family protein [Algibacter amylolyticus]